MFKVILSDALQSTRVFSACPAGWPAVSTPVLRSLAGKPGAALKALKEKYGVDLHVAGRLAAKCTIPYKQCYLACCTEGSWPTT